ncbi:MAG: N-acetyltransferase [Betaproteobacteria bacterium]|nr:N-acetyltransferase [Betaproteobacteria bacterium]
MAAQIRLAQGHDAESIAAIYRPFVETTAISFETEAPDREEMVRRITETMASYPWLVCEIGGQVAGYAYATRHRVRAAYRWSVDTSVYVGQKYWRGGVGRGLYASLFGILAAQGFFNAYAGITLPNPASVALHQSVGFKGIGVHQRVGYKLGAWHDVGWWQLRLKASESSPREPRDLATVRSEPGWESLVTSGQTFIRAKAA